VNYSPVILDLDALKGYKPHERALLFKTLGWKYDGEIDGSYWWNLSEVIKPNETFYQIYALGTSEGIWIRSKAVLRRDSRFAGDRVGYGSIGANGVLVFPTYKDTKLLWVKKKPVDQYNSEILAYYPGITLKGSGKSHEWSASAYKQTDGQIIREVLEKIERGPGIVQIMVTSEGYAYGKYLGSQYCQVKAFWDENNT